MKKIIYSAILAFGFLNANIYGCFTRITYRLDQEAVKKSTLFKDGVSFTEMEQSVRKKHSNIPSILLVDTMVDGLFGQDTGMDAAFIPQDKMIWASRATASTHNSKAFEWAMLHETGHAQQPNNMPAIQGAVGITQLLTGYYWGMHKAKPYKNLLTKLGSKTFAAMLAGSVVGSTLMKAEERRADNWANSVADKQALLGGIEYFDCFRSKLQDQWSGYKIGSIVPFSVGKYLMSPLHPNVDSRIAKIKTALKARFGVEA